MDSNQTIPKATPKDFFLNLGAIIALFTVIYNFTSLLFTVISKVYSTVTSSYTSYYSISFPVATLIILFPVYILLMWLLERDYRREPERIHLAIRKWLTYITLFLSGLAVASDLVTVVYYFIDGQDLTTGFVLKALTVLAVALAVFSYYITDVMGKVTQTSRRVWMGVSCVIVIGAIILGFSVLGSPHTQQLLKYDEQKVSDLQNLSNQVQDYWSINKKLPEALTDIVVCSITSLNTYGSQGCTDQQTGKQFEYKKTGETTYSVCAEFNKDSQPLGYLPYVWAHPAGHFCFAEAVSQYPRPIPLGK